MREYIKAIRRKFKGNGLYKIYNLFRRDVLKGFRDYEKIVKKYGRDVAILSTAWRGTGDYFICGLYLDAFLKQNRISNYVFLTPNNGGERKVVKLFYAYRSHVIEIKNITPIRVFDSFLMKKESNIFYFHHGYQNPNNLSVSVSGISMTGHNGLNMVDFYLYFGLKIDENVAKSVPEFIKDENIINKWFEENHLNLGKTILISPYSTGLKEYEMPEEFWENLACELRRRGYTLVTNCAGEEKRISGTIALSIPYDQIVPVLEKAGYFIGIRSGLCDIISGASCKKIVLYTYKAKWWIDGRSIQYTGLNNMGLCDDAIEFVYRDKEELDILLRNILESLQYLDMADDQGK